MNLKETLENLKLSWDDLKNLDFKSMEEHLGLQDQVAWLIQRYHPARILTFVGILVIGVGVVGTGISLALLTSLLLNHTPMELITKVRFPLMVSILRCLLFVWIFFTGFGVVTRKRWAGISCMIGYVLVESQSVYVGEHFLVSLGLSLAAFLACFVVQLHWEVLMARMDDSFPLECNHDSLMERSKGFNFWGYYTYCPGCQKQIFFWDNVLATVFLLFFSVSWAVWWYWPLLPLV